MKVLKHILIGLALYSGVGVYADIKVSDAFVHQTQNVDPKIKVLLADNNVTALVEVKGAYKIYDNDKLIHFSPVGKRCVIHALYDGILWGDMYDNVKCLKIEPADNTVYTFVNGSQYQGTLYIYQMDNHTVAIVNEVLVEDYLKSVLSLKYLKELDKEALSACVILERTAFYEYLLSAQDNNSLWHLKAKDYNYQGYAVTKQHYGVEEAVDWTARLVLDNPSGIMINAEDLLSSNVEGLAIQGLNAREILEKFYPDANFVVIESWDDDSDQYELEDIR